MDAPQPERKKKRTREGAVQSPQGGKGSAAASGKRKRSGFRVQNLIETPTRPTASPAREEVVIGEEEDEVVEVPPPSGESPTERKKRRVEAGGSSPAASPSLARTSSSEDGFAQPVLWVARCVASRSDQDDDSNVQRYDLPPDCTFSQLNMHAGQLIKRLELSEGVTLVDFNGGPLTEENWESQPKKWAILREKGAPINIKNIANITPVTNIINSFIVDIQPLVCLTEIIDNAIEATSDTQLNLRGRVVKITTNKRRKTITIEDNGIGMGEQELEAFGRLGHTTRSKASNSRIVAPPYFLSSEFGRYGIGAKSAGLGLGSGYLVETKRESDSFVHTKRVSKDQIMSDGWKAEVGIRSPERGEGSHFTRFTIYEVIDQFWEKSLQLELRPFLADIYHFYLHGPPNHLGLPPVDLHEFVPVNIIVDGQPLRETKGNIREFIDQASSDLTWHFAVNIPDNLLEGVNSIWGFISYYPITDGKETLPVPYQQLLSEQFAGKPELAYQELPLRARDPGLNFFWVGRLFPKMERKRLPWMEPNFRAGKSKVPIHCFDRIKGAIFFPRSMVATSHKQQFGVNEKLIEYLYKQLKEFGPSEKAMAEQFKKLRETYRRMLTKWHNHDAEAFPLGNKLVTERKIDGVSYYSHISFRGQEYKKADKVRIVESKKKEPEYGEIQMFELDSRGKKVCDKVIVLLWTHERTETTKTFEMNYVEKLTDEEFAAQIKMNQAKLPSRLAVVYPKPDEHGDLVLNAREQCDVGVVILDGYGETMDKFPFGILFDKAKDQHGNPVTVPHSYLLRPNTFQGWDKRIFFFLFTPPSPGRFTLYFSPGTRDGDTFFPDQVVPPLKAKFVAKAGEPTILSAKWDLKSQDVTLMMGELMPSIKVQQFDKNKNALTFPEDASVEISIEGRADEQFEISKKGMKIEVEGTVILISGLVVVPRAGVRLDEDLEIAFPVTVDNNLSSSLKAEISTGAPAKLTVQPVGQVKEYYKKGEFLPELSIHLEDKYGNAVRVPQVMMVANMKGCEAQKKKFKVKNGEKVLPERFFEIIGNYGKASFDLVVQNYLVSDKSFPLAPVHLCIYHNNQRLGTEEKGPEGEEILVVEAGTTLRGLEVWLLSESGELIDDFKGLLVLTLAKNQRNVKKYRFKDGKAAISGINAAKKAGVTYALDFYAPQLEGAGDGARLSVILKTVFGAPHKLGKLTIEAENQEGISCGDRINLSVELQDVRDNAIDFSSLSAPFKRKLLRSLDLRVIKASERARRTSQLYNYRASNWIEEGNKLHYKDLLVAGRDICGPATLHLCYEETEPGEGHVKDEEEEELEINLEHAELPISFEPGPINDMTCHFEEVVVEAGQQMPPLAWQVVDQWGHGIQPKGGRVVMVENTELGIKERMVVLRNGIGEFEAIEAPYDLARYPFSLTLAFRYEDNEGNLLQKDLRVEITQPQVPRDIAVYIHGSDELKLSAGHSLGVVQFKLLGPGGQPFSAENMVSLSFVIMGREFLLKDGNFEADCSNLGETCTLSGSSIPFRLTYLGQNGRKLAVEKQIRVVPDLPHKLVADNTINDRIGLDDPSKPVKLHLSLHLVDRHENTITDVGVLINLHVQPTVSSGDKRWQTAALPFRSDGKVEYSEALMLPPGSYRLDFVCASRSEQIAVEPYSCTFTVADLFRMQEMTKQLHMKCESLKREFNQVNQDQRKMAQSIQLCAQEKSKAEYNITTFTRELQQLKEVIEARRREAASVTATLNAPDVEPRFGADRQLDRSITTFKAYESELPLEARSHIRGMVRDKFKIRNVRLANMLAYHWGFDKLCTILVDGQHTLRALSRWEEQSRVFLDLLDVPDWESKVEYLQGTLTPANSPDDDPAFIKFEFRSSGSGEFSFQPSTRGHTFPVAAGSHPAEWLKQVNDCLAHASFLINCLYIPQNARRWRPLFYKILTHNMIIFNNEADMYRYISLTKDSSACMSLDSDRRTGGTVKTMAYRPHLFEKNGRRIPRAFIEDLDARERESRQHLMSLREGQSIGHLKSMEQEMAVQVSKLQKEQSRLHDLEEQIQQLHQLDAEQKQQREELRQRISAVTTEIRSLGPE